MKRKLALLLVAAMCVGLYGCSSKETESTETETTTESTENESSTTASEDVDYNAADYVTLGEYKNLDITITGDYSTDEEALNDYIDDLLADADYVKDDSQTEVLSDSIVNVDYTGILDGEAFDGGSATDQTLDVANNSSVEGTTYIDGFTSGLVGAKVGETVDCNVTFPEDYSATNLAGKEVIFRFTINYICKAGVSREELTDDYVKENYDCDTVDDFYTKCQSDLEAEVSDQKSSDIRSAVVEQVIANATISGYPDAVVEQRYEAYIASYTERYGDYDTFESAVTSTYGITMDEFKEEVVATIKSNLDTEMVFGVVADTEGITLDEEGFETYCQSLMTKYGLSSKDDLFGSYGTSAKDGERYIRRIYVCNQAVEYCIDNVGNVNISEGE
ncbi:MAG: FKBP-type peptidyl-prolyl cis-trans isomerase [Lachnospiraceae bacterium]|nr:FKBP-type peptidyl-prolyl cis-trans isomerase [Lachnospiraceae bacterium]